VGHAIAAIALASAVLGWETRLVSGVTDGWLGQLLGINRQHRNEAEHADCLLALYPQDQGSLPDLQHHFFMPDLIEFQLQGQPNQLSVNHHPWPVIDEVSEAAMLITQPSSDFSRNSTWSSPPASLIRSLTARQIIRQRRSAVSMDGQTTLSRDAFYQMMQRSLPGSHPPVAAFPWQPAVHLILFLHRVDDLPSGLYLLVRDPDQLSSLRSALRNDFQWQKPIACPDDLSLWLLATQDLQDVARGLSCNQDIASDGAFAVAMLTAFEPLLRRYGSWFYKRLHWEAGAVGQTLYLEAEAVGLRGCGIGCFFDDAAHQVLGLRDRRFQVLYHFAVGGAVEDERLQTLPAYWHLENQTASDQP
jgi:nitroreductase